MDQDFYINKDISHKILMLGVYYKNNTPGGMASLISIYEKYFFKLKYISTWKLSNRVVQIYYLLYSLSAFYFSMCFDKKIQIVHIHGAAYMSFYRKRLFINIASFFKKKIIYHMHAGEFEDFFNRSKRKNVIIKTINKVDRFLVLSDSWKQYFVGIGVKEDKILVINNVVDPICDVEVHKAYQSRINVLFLGLLVKAKGVYDLLDVIIENKQDLENTYHFYIAGNGDDYHIVKLIKEHKLDNFVTFLGWIQGSKKLEVLKATNIFVLPSYFEGLPMSILEAMSCGAAIIASKVGGIPEVVHSDVNGILIEPGDKSALRDAFLKMRDNSRLLSIFKENNLELIKDFYPSSVFNVLKDLYVDLLQKND